MKKKYLITETTESVKNKIKAKSIAFNMPIDELVIKAIDSYTKEIKCIDCNVNEVVYTTLKHNVEVDGVEDIEVIINNFPTTRCIHCSDEGDEYMIVPLVSLILEQVENFIIETRFKNKDQSNKYIFDFFDLLKL